MTDLIPPSPSPSSQPPQRHGCLTVWLGLIALGSLITAIKAIIDASRLSSSLSALGTSLPAMTVIEIAILVLCALANVYFAYLLFKWEKLGFYGYAATSVIILIVNLMIGVPFISALLGLLGIVILYAVLQIGGPNKAWPYLREPAFLARPGSPGPGM